MAAQAKARAWLSTPPRRWASTPDARPPGSPLPLTSCLSPAQVRSVQTPRQVTWIRDAGCGERSGVVGPAATWGSGDPPPKEKPLPSAPVFSREDQGLHFL